MYKHFNTYLGTFGMVFYELVIHNFGLNCFFREIFCIFNFLAAILKKNRYLKKQLMNDFRDHYIRFQHDFLHRMTYVT
jgi:hypothetical protein